MSETATLTPEASEDSRVAERQEKIARIQGKIATRALAAANRANVSNGLNADQFTVKAAKTELTVDKNPNNPAFDTIMTTKGPEGVTEFTIGEQNGLTVGKFGNTAGADRSGIAETGSPNGMTLAEVDKDAFRSLNELRASVPPISVSEQPKV